MIHPECKEDIKKECKRLKQSNPASRSAARLRLAVNYIFALSVANTMDFYLEMGIPPYGNH